MRSLEVTLVNPPHQAHPLGDEKEIAPPLGLLRLADGLIRAGHVPRIEDLNLRWHTDPALRRDFYGRAAERILEGSPDVVGFTSMAVDTHVALQLAAEVKARAPDTVVALGGPHAGLLSREIRERWSCVDLVVRGDGVRPLAEMASRLARLERGPRRVAAARGDAIPGDVAPDAERWDFRSAYALVDWDDYFRITGRRHANVEGGRGCRYRCSFCYSPAHHAGWRTAPVDALLEELEYLRGVGVDDVFFVEDNFLNAPDWSVQAARAIGAALPGLSWSCYATLPALSGEVLGELGAGGCRAVFSGVDAITPVARRTYHKAFARQISP
ncbi:MAG TPA: cobalamin-dependent protein, partial [Longimicrobiaceae bacterium]|nr:cobalamin-dependent protein [Longimicrobiaceae bacterium]